LPTPVEPPSAPARSLPTWAALAAAVGLISVVALASRSTTVPLIGALDLRLGFRAVEVVGYVAFFLGLALLPWVIILRARRRAQLRVVQRSRQRAQPPAPAWAQAIGVVFIAGLAVVEVYVVLGLLNELLRAARVIPDEQPIDAGAASEDGITSFADGDPIALAVALIVVLAIGLALVVFLIRWRRDDEADRDADAPRAQDVRRRAAEVSLDALAREPDPRRAIIAAYAAMERSLSRAGLGRMDSEAPIEYLDRVLAGSPGAGPQIRTVSHLFQIAKFSAHPVDESMRSEAISALERIRGATAAPA
jgi:hypothetical protein